MEYVAASVMTLIALVCIGLTLLTLPGIWTMIAAALLINWLWEPLYSPWTLAAAFALGVVAELVELLASAAGTKKAGGTKHGAIWSIVGAMIGAIAGSILIPIPIVGTVVGGVVGAGLAAVAGEMAFGKQHWKDAARIGQGAAIGRLFSTVLKAGLAVVVALLLIIAAFI
jgi:uncharacterized protein YqgC (DUF456 family)